MNSANKKWVVAITGPAQKSLKRIPIQDQLRVRAAMDEMEVNPFQGDVRKLKGDRNGFRRRVGDWRIFDPYPDQRIVITGIERRTSTTY